MAKGSPVAGFVLTSAFALTACVAASLVVGAHVAELLGSALAGWTAAFAACVALPVVVGERVAGTEAKLPIIAGAVATFDVLWLLLLLGLAPAASRRALAEHGDWFVGGDSPGLRSMTRALGSWIPRSEDPGPEVSSRAGEERDGSTDSTAQTESPAQTPARGPLTASPTGPLTAPSSGPSTAPASGPLSAHDLFAARADAVVTILVRRPFDPGDPLSGMLRRAGLETLEVSGSGVLVAASGTIVTNHHVMRDAASARVTLRGGRTFDLVNVLASDPANDLDLIQVPGGDLAIATLAPADDEIEVGERVFAIGSPFGLDHTLTEGIVSAIRDEGGTSMVQMQAPIAPGSSGGPLFDDRGRVIGINTATRSAGLHFAVAARHVRDLVVMPRAPRPLERYTSSVHVASLETGGAALLPTTRMTLHQVALATARMASGCIETWPTADPTVRLEMGARRPTFHSDQGETVDRCLDERGDFIAFAASRPLREASDRAFTVIARVEGLGPEGARTMTVALARTE